ncbi:MAG: DNA-binding response regulator [Anaerolineales bacterium]|nr:response regulator transcription factor [Anaerolineae bacterium]PWB51498.1 MAG: DNA-binding response regulator [Anaerolineales bacterium]
MAENEIIKVLIVDDHQVVRQGLRTFLELHADISVIGEAEDGLRALEMIELHHPDVVLMDLVMPGMNGITTIRKVRESGIPTKIIALTSFSDDDKVFSTIQAGAASYLLKDVSPDELVEAIRAVQRGDARLHPDITRRLMDQVSQVNSASQEISKEELTGREKEVICLVALGRNNREIAKELYISEKTVKTHISNSLSKLHLSQRTQLAIYAIKNHLVEI